MAKPVPKRPAEVELMREAGRMACRVLRKAAQLVEPGISTRDLDAQVGEIIREQGGVSAFLGYRGFPMQCCLSVNEAVIHGIGSGRRLQFGDILKLDVGVRYKGFVGDVAMTVAVGGCSPRQQDLMDVTIKSLHAGIAAAKPGGRVGEIGKAVQKVVEAAGYGVVREFCGHGVGRSVHEEPQVPNYADRGSGSRTVLVPGMTLAIEPMVTLGSPAVRLLDDDWTVVTVDGQVSAHFEHTIAITDAGAEILTKDDEVALY